jgi:triacylglycerol esterase/lipase EstA (alpha/beta hydrolase family)
MNTASRARRHWQPGRIAGAALALMMAACGSSGPLEDPRPPASSGPALKTDGQTLAAALDCPAQFAGREDPVLMVHGTGTDPGNDWSWSYVPALGVLGYDVCTVRLPHGAFADIQESSEYVVHALRQLMLRSGRRVSVIGYSQGALEARWAIRWWPDVRAGVARYISLAGVHHGSPVTDLACSTPCSPASWQMRPSSQFLAALNAGDPTPGAMPYTSLWSETDSTAVPPTSILEGAASIALQSLCADRRVSHTGILGDAVAFALVVDALTHEGPANPARIDPAVCAADVAPGMDAQFAATREARGLLPFVLYDRFAPKPAAEPPLADYAQGGDT